MSTQYSLFDAPSNQDSDASLARSRQREEVRFTVPYTGPSGAQLLGYIWPNKKEEFIDYRGEDRVRTISDWDFAVRNIETNRQIVHQFAVKTAESGEQAVSAESAAMLLGISVTSVRSNARKLLENEIAGMKKLALEIKQADRIDAMAAQATPAEAITNMATTYAVQSPLVQRMMKGKDWTAMPNRIEREEAGREIYRFLVKNNKYIWSGDIVNEKDELYRRGWRNIEYPAYQLWPQQIAINPDENRQQATATDENSRAAAGGQEGLNGYYYKGGQFLPSTMAEPGKWKADGKWINAGKALVAPGVFENQPTPFSRSLFELIKHWCPVQDGKLIFREGIKDSVGMPLTLNTPITPGVKGMLGKESITLGEIINAYNDGQRWFDVQPDALTITTQRAIENDDSLAQDQDQLESIDPLDDPIERETTSPHNTDDAGQELSYNKRNRMRKLSWEDIKDQDPALRVKEAIKAKIYPKPDYQDLIDHGAHSNEQFNRVVAFVVKHTYDALSVKPEVRGAPNDEQLQTYITGVNRYMDGVMTWAKNKDQTLAWFKKVGSRASVMAGAMSGTPVALTTLIDTPEKTILESVYPDGYKNYLPEIRIVGGNKPLAALQPGTDIAVKALKEIEKGWPVSQEAWQRQGYRIILGSKLGYELYQGTRKDQSQYVSVIVALHDGRYEFTIENFMVEGIENKEDPRAIQAAEARIAKLNNQYLLLNKRNKLESVAETEEEAKEAARQVTKRSSSEMIKEEALSVNEAERSGVPRRGPGENISSEELMATFGFKGVNFGNWMKGDSNEAERQLHLNHAYDSFMDLAEILDMPPKAMGINGMLGIAFGAQGSGRAAAHFVPGVNEINMTRTQGAGFLAHEWGHAVDHNFAKLAGLERQIEPYLSAHCKLPEKHTVFEMSAGKQLPVEKNRFSVELRPEILNIYRGIVDAMNSRPMEDSELAGHQDARAMKTAKNIESWLSAIKRDYLSNKVSELAFNDLAERIRKLDLGDGHIALSKNKAISPTVAELRGLYKTATGRAYSIENIMGLQANVDHLKYIKENQGSVVVHTPQKTSTTYAKNALVLDKHKGGKQYWSTTCEKFARAFDAYVADKLEAKTIVNTYLSAFSGSPMAAPQGLERSNINAYFEQLVQAIETKETELGFKIFEPGTSYGVVSDFGFIQAQLNLDLSEIDGETSIKSEKVIQTNGAVERQTVPGIYYVTSHLEKVGERELPVTIETFQDLANATSYLAKYAVEHYDAIVTDINHKPLAMIGSFKGAPTQTSVYPATVIQELARIEGAANLWTAHNHPSGAAELSNADKRLNDAFAEILDNTGINYRGLIAIAGKKWVATSNELGDLQSIELGDLQSIKSGTIQVPVVERHIVGNPRNDLIISGPNESKKYIPEISNGKAGILFLSHSRSPVAFVPFEGHEMFPLRKDEKFTKILNAVSATSASAAIISNPYNSFSVEQIGNLNALFSKLDITVIDGINFNPANKDVPALALSESGNLFRQSVFYSKENSSGRIPKYTHHIHSARDALENAFSGMEKAAIESMLDSGAIRVITEAQAKNIISDQSMFMTAWHGSPHDHDKFDMIKVGAGEGVNAYGYGLYFAENKSVAEHYRKSFKSNFNALNKIAVDHGMSLSGAKAIAEAFQKNISFEDFKSLINSMGAYPSVENWRAAIRSELHIAKEVWGSYTRTGLLYQVELTPGEDEYLDWDKPLSQQSDKVKSGIERAVAVMESIDIDQGFFLRNTIDPKYEHKTVGATLYRSLSAIFSNYDNDQNGLLLSSELLLNNGIRGIRYLDRNSREEAMGTHNYVLFDDKDISIIKKQGSKLFDRNNPDIRYSQEDRSVAFYNPHEGVTYFIADNISNEYTKKQWRGLALHEIAVHAMHLGKDQKEFNNILATLEELKSKGDFKVIEAYDSVPRNTPANLVNEEALAYLVQRYPDISVSRRFNAWLKNCIRSIGDTMEPVCKIPFIAWANNINSDDLAYMARSTLVNYAKTSEKQTAGIEKCNVRTSGNELSKIETVVFDKNLSLSSIEQNKFAHQMKAVDMPNSLYPLDREIIEDEISRLRAQWPSMPPIHIINDVSSLPFEANKRARGIYSQGNVYIVAPKIYSIPELQKVMAHECILHHTFFEMHDSYQFSKIHEGIQTLKSKGDPIISEIANYLASVYEPLSPEDETREIIAHAGEKCLDERGNIKIEYGFMKPVFASLASWLRDHGISVPFTNFELQGIICQAGKFIQREKLNTFDSINSTKGGLYSGRILDVQKNIVIQKTGLGINDVEKHHFPAYLKKPMIGQIVDIVYKNGQPSVFNIKSKHELAR